MTAEDKSKLAIVVYYGHQPHRTPLERKGGEIEMRLKLPRQAKKCLVGQIRSDGWARCEGCGDVPEPVFPHTYQDVDGRVTVYYCRYCFKYVEGCSVDEKNHYPETQYMNVMVSQGKTVKANYFDWLRERNARRKLIKALWGSRECPTCKGIGKIAKAPQDSP